ncbi:MAG TPA: YggS family pyridoxal phosphate-dependent enzyme [Bacteroidales bacterium]|nr:YggS family pyridoxal phosphate-dependent enzyme [Bacteroidales bacterium]
MTPISQFLEFKKPLPAHVKLVAVSKTKTEKEIMEVYDAPHRCFGENKVQELVPKYLALPKDIEWHMVGHLQSNKVKYIAPFISMIQSVDSLKLLSVINKEAQKNNRVIQCLLQIHIANEETKFGLNFDEARDLLKSEEFAQFGNVEIRGVMGMATFTDNFENIRKEFRALKETFDMLKQEFFRENDNFSEISMGMTDDFRIAIEEGSTIVRIGSGIFGSRT